WAPFAKPICPAWGVTESTLADLGVDFAFADRHAIVGESYWELEALTRRRDELAPILAPRLRPAPEPKPEPPPPGQPTLEDMELNAWGPAWRAKDYLRGVVGTPLAPKVAGLIHRATPIPQQGVGAP